MPMQKSSTQIKCQPHSKVDSIIKEPKEATLNFIKQFARVYACNGSQLTAVVLN